MPQTYRLYPEQMPPFQAREEGLVLWWMRLTLRE